MEGDESEVDAVWSIVSRVQHRYQRLLLIQSEDESEDEIEDEDGREGGGGDNL